MTRPFIAIDNRSQYHFYVPKIERHDSSALYAVPRDLAARGHARRAVPATLARPRGSSHGHRLQRGRRDLPGLELLSPPDEFPTDPPVMVTFDCGSLSRLGDLEPAAKGAQELIVIDHHVSNDRYGTINLVEASAADSSDPSVCS